MHQTQIRTESVLFVLSCFVFCEITTSLLITLPFRAVILYFGSKYPRAPDLSEIHAKGRGSLQPGASRDPIPPWEPPQSRPRRWEFRTAKCESRPRHSDFFTAKRESRLRRPEFATAKCESRLRRPDFFTAKRESRPRHLDFFTAKRESRPPCPDFFTAKWQSRLRHLDFFTAKCES